MTLLSLMACSKKELNYEAYNAYINNSDNGLFKQSTVDGVDIKLRHLPLDYIVYQEVKRLPNYSPQFLDSVYSDYENSVVFLLSLSSTNAVGSMEEGVMFKGIRDIESYKQRALDLTFSMGEYISLRNQEAEIKPELTNLENTYDLNEGRSIYVVFSKETIERELGDSNWEFVFEDELFRTGVSVFTFDKDDIENIPSLMMEGRKI